MAIMSKREELIKLLLKSRPPVSWAFFTIPPDFFHGLRDYIGFTEYEMMILFGVPAKSIKDKLEAKPRIKKTVGKKEDEKKEELTDIDNLSIDQQIAYIDKRCEEVIRKQSKFAQGEWVILKDIRSNLVKERDRKFEEGLDLLTKILMFFKAELVPQVREKFGKFLINIKREITYSVFSQVWKTFKGETIEIEGEDGDEAKAEQARKDKELKEEMLNQVLHTVETEVETPFDIDTLFYEACQKNSVLMEQVDRFEQTEQKVKVVGGGVTKDYGGKSQTGGAQYKKKEDEG